MKHFNEGPLEEIENEKSGYGPAEIAVWILLILGLIFFMLVYL